MICKGIQTNILMINLYLCFSNILGTFSSFFMKDHQDKSSPRFLDVHRHVLFGFWDKIWLSDYTVVSRFSIGVKVALWKWKFYVWGRKRDQEWQFIKVKPVFLFYPAKRMSSAILDYFLSFFSLKRCKFCCWIRITFWKGDKIHFKLVWWIISQREQWQQIWGRLGVSPEQREPSAWAGARSNQSLGKPSVPGRAVSAGEQWAAPKAVLQQPL